ncbi:MAG: hypothetical protein WCQ99_03610 [Pseudomonadota bacterium]
MLKTIEAYYKNGKIIYKDALPNIKTAKLFITIVEEKPSTPSKLGRFKGIFKKKVDGMAYQKKMRSEWS